MENKRLIDGNTLGERHPALRNKYRRQWLLRQRLIPFVKVGRLIFFDEAEIEKWIEENSFKNGGKKR